MGTCTDADLIIPSSHENLAVKKIEQWAFTEFDSTTDTEKKHVVKSVTIGGGITTIGDRAFYYFTLLTNVTIGNSVTKIRKDAFDRCTSLTNIIIPDSVISIGKQVFVSCSSLISVTIGNGVTNISGNLFIDCYSLTSVTFKNTSGWTAGDTSISSSDLADPATAAKYLSYTYRYDTWTRG